MTLEVPLAELLGNIQMGRIASVALVSLVFAPTIAVARVDAQNVVTATDGELRVEWSTATRAGGQPVIEGYVISAGGWWFRRVLLNVEALDASGRALGQTVVNVPGDVPAGGRVYFKAALGTTGTAYRLAFLSAERYGWGASGN